LAIFDLFVIGGGSGGVRAARIAASHGARVALAEEDRVGGTCVIRGCVPKKLMVYAASFHDDFEDSQHFGWSLGAKSFDWPSLTNSLDREIDRLNKAYIRGLDAAGVTVFHDRAILEIDGLIRLRGADEIHEARNILVATGGHPNRTDGIPGAEYAITSEAIFGLPKLPQRILVVGAGYVAIEFASIMAGLGVSTTLLHRGAEILRTFDNDIRAEMHRAMELRGIEIVLNDELGEIAKEAVGLTVTTKQGRALVADQVLLAIGRSPNTVGFGLAEAGVALDEVGAIQVDQMSETSVPSVFAVGDVTNRINLTPVAIREGHTLADRLFGGGTAIIDHEDIPHAVFGIPEIGAVGITEEDARARFPDLDIYEAAFPTMRHQFAARDQNALLKMIVDARTNKVLGCHILGPNAAELVQLIAIPIKMRATKADIDAALAVHPTMAEELVTMREPKRRIRAGASE
jgi:glutathione reductase (NADPH)